jgi:hypothetical protein
MNGIERSFSKVHFDQSFLDFLKSHPAHLLCQLRLKLAHRIEASMLDELQEPPLVFERTVALWEVNLSFRCCLDALTLCH